MSWRGFWLIYITWGQNASSLKIVDKESDCDTKPAFVDKITTRDELLRQLKIRRKFWNLKRNIKNIWVDDINVIDKGPKLGLLDDFLKYLPLLRELAADVIVYNRVDFVIT